MSFPSGRVRLLLKSCLTHCVLQLMGAEGSDGPTQQTERDAVKSQENPREHDAPQAEDAFSSSFCQQFQGTELWRWRLLLCQLVTKLSQEANYHESGRTKVRGWSLFFSRRFVLVCLQVWAKCSVTMKDQYQCSCIQSQRTTGNQTSNTCRC